MIEALSRPSSAVTPTTKKALKQVTLLSDLTHYIGQRLSQLQEATRRCARRKDTPKYKREKKKYQKNFVNTLLTRQKQAVT